MNTDNDLEKLLQNLPFFIQQYLHQHPYKNELIEIVLDLGRRPEARFSHGPEYLSQKIISWQDLDYITQRISKFSSENRAGIERTLHRISCIRNRQFLINGLTCRVGRAVFGTISIIRDLLESDKSILILGRPGVGKTTIIREIGRVLADEMEKRVIIIDTSNEIAGDSDIPHFGIGRARRMQVSQTELENLIKNPSLAELIGGIKYVTLSDEEAKRRGTQKSILERKSYPTFELVIEINNSNCWTIHEDVAHSVDLFLRNNSGKEQIRQILLPEKVQIKCHNYYPYASFLMKNIKNSNQNLIPSERIWTEINQFNSKYSSQLTSKNLIIYSYSISNNFIKEAMSKLNIRFVLTNDIKKASIIIGLKKHLINNLKLKKLANQKNIPIYSLNQLSIYQFMKLIQNFS